MTGEDMLRLHDLIDGAAPDDVKDALKEAVGLIDDVMNGVGPNPRATLDRIEHILKGGK